MKALQIRTLAPLMRLALRSFKGARTAVAKGRVDQVILLLNRGMGCLEVIEGSLAPRR